MDPTQFTAACFMGGLAALALILLIGMAVHDLIDARRRRRRKHSEE